MVFKVLLILNFSLVAVLLLWSYVMGNAKREEFGGGVFFLDINAIYTATPLLVPFVALNTWGAFRYRYKVIYIFLTAVFLVWVIYGFYMWPRVVFP